MAQYDLPLERLREHRSATAVPSDFAEFWDATLSGASAHALDPVARPVDVGLTGVDVQDLRFGGWDGTPVAAWLYVPRGRAAPGPAVVEYVGYTAGRGHPLQHLVWSALGYVHLVVDTRGQGTSASAWA